MNKTKWIFFFLLLFGVLGYFREFFFVHLNIILYENYYHTASSVPVPAIMRVFSRFSYDTLYYSKYVYTFLFTVIFFTANYWALKKLTHNPYFLRLLFYSYGVMLLLATASMIYGYFVNERLQSDEYTLSRWLLGVAQSPIICLILLASEKLYNKSFPS
jgi:hypothetical protein